MNESCNNPNEIYCPHIFIVQQPMRTISFQHVPANLNDYPITAIAESKDSTLYASYGNANLYRVAQGSLEYITHINTPATSTTGSYPSINTIQEPMAGRLWFTTSEGQIISIRHRKIKFEQPVYFSTLQTDNVSTNSTIVTPENKYVISVPANGIFVADIKRLITTPLVGPPGKSSLQSNIIYSGVLGGDYTIFWL